MATIAAIRDGLKVRLQTITALANRSHDVWPDQIHVPCALVKPLAMGHKEAMGGKRVRTFEIILLADSLEAGHSITRAQDALDAYLDDTGASSVIAALEGDKTLGGIVTTLDVSWDEYGAKEINQIEYLGVNFEVRIWD